MHLGAYSLPRNRQLGGFFSARQNDFDFSNLNQWGVENSVRGVGEPSARALWTRFPPLFLARRSGSTPVEDGLGEVLKGLSICHPTE